MNGWKRLFVFIVTLVCIPLFGLWLLEKPKNNYETYIYRCSDLSQFVSPNKVTGVFKEPGYINSTQAEQSLISVFGAHFDKNNQIKSVVVKSIQKERTRLKLSDLEDESATTTYAVDMSDGKTHKITAPYKANEDAVKAFAEYTVNMSYKNPLPVEAASTPSNVDQRFEFKHSDAPWDNPDFVVLLNTCRNDLLELARGESQKNAYKKWFSKLFYFSFGLIIFFMLIYLIGWGLGWVKDGFISIKK